jgi:hypothetical protein
MPPAGSVLDRRPGNAGAAWVPASRDAVHRVLRAFASIQWQAGCRAAVLPDRSFKGWCGLELFLAARSPRDSWPRRTPHLVNRRSATDLEDDGNIGIHLPRTGHEEARDATAIRGMARIIWRRSMLFGEELTRRTGEPIVGLLPRKTTSGLARGWCRECLMRLSQIGCDRATRRVKVEALQPFASIPRYSPRYAEADSRCQVQVTISVLCTDSGTRVVHRRSVSNASASED